VIAEEFVAALRQLLLVEHLTMYQNEVLAANNPIVIEGLDLGEETESEAFLASLDEQQQVSYLSQVRSVIAATTTAILAIVDGENPVGRTRVEFTLVPKGGDNIAGELSDLFVEAEMASRPAEITTDEMPVVPPGETGTGVVFFASASPDSDVAEDDVADNESAGDDVAGDDPEPMDAEEFVNRVREVLFDGDLPSYVQMVENIAHHGGDPSARGFGSRAFTFLAGLDDDQRAAYFDEIHDVMNNTGVNILGILDGETATRGDYVEFAVIPPGGDNIAGDLQELFLIANEDGPSGA